jgi:hypothetical protein
MVLNFYKLQFFFVCGHRRIKFDLIYSEKTQQFILRSSHTPHLIQHVFQKPLSTYLSVIHKHNSAAFQLLCFWLLTSHNS